MAAKVEVIALTPDRKRSQFASDTSGGRYFVTLRVGDYRMREDRIYTAYKLRTAAEEQDFKRQSNLRLGLFSSDFYSSFGSLCLH